VGCAGLRRWSWRLQVFWGARKGVQSWPWSSQGTKVNDPQKWAGWPVRGEKQTDNKAPGGWGQGSRSSSQQAGTLKERQLALWLLHLPGCPQGSKTSAECSGNFYTMQLGCLAIPSPLSPSGAGCLTPLSPKVKGYLLLGQKP
jgi:hypothetical protein